MTDKLLDHLKRALGDAYTIQRELSGAGMSRVFVAQEHSLGREVVIKVLPKELAAGVNRERFQQEVQLAARLSHPYIVPLLHAGEHEDLLWFTMPFITGDSLRSRLEKEGALPVRDVVQLTRDVVEALAYAHSRGVIHRDIKPANILVDGGHAVVTDFGVAKALSAAMPSMGAGHTTTGMAIGTPAYMAPEQLAADPAADHRVDIYAVGLMMYELLSGASPFATQSPTATMTAQLTRMPDPIEKVRKDVPSALSALISHCLAKSPDERPATADEILKALDHISGELAAAVHGNSGKSFATRRMIPITAALAIITVAAAATIVVSSAGKGSGADTSLTVPPAIPVGSGDLGAPTSPLETPKVWSRADSLKTCLTVTDSLTCERVLSKAPVQTQTAAKTTSPTTPVPPTPDLSALIKSAVDSQLKAMGVTMQRAQVTVTNVGAAPTVSGSRAAIVNAQTAGNAPRKVVIGWFPPIRRGGGGGGAIDSSALGVIESFIGDFTRMNQRAGWNVVRRDASQPPTPGDTLRMGANAVVSINVSPIRDSPDSLDLFLTVSNQTGGLRYVRKTIPEKSAASDYQAILFQASAWLRELRLNPGVVWEGGGRQGFRGGPGGPDGGRGGGGGGGGQRRPIPDSTGRGGGNR